MRTNRLMRDGRRRVAADLELSAGKFRQKHSGVALVLGEPWAEFLREKGLFAAGFQVKGKESNRDGNQPSHLTSRDRTANQGDQNSCVNRMTDGAVWARTNQFVPFLQSNDAAPIGTQVPASPYREGHTNGRNPHACPFRSWTHGNEARAQPAVVSLWTTQEIKSDYQRQRIEETLEIGLLLFGHLAIKRGNEPVQTEGNPAKPDPPSGRREIHCSSRWWPRFWAALWLEA